MNILVEDFTSILKVVSSTEVAMRVMRSRGLTLVIECNNHLFHGNDEYEEFSRFSFGYWRMVGAGMCGLSRVCKKEAVL